MTNFLIPVDQHLGGLSQILAAAGHDIATTVARDATTLVREAAGRVVVLSDPAMFEELLESSVPGLIVVALGAERINACFSVVNSWVLRQNRRLRRRIMEATVSDAVRATLTDAALARATDGDILRAEMAAESARYIQYRSNAFLAGDAWHNEVEVALAIGQLVEALTLASPHGRVWVVSACSVLEFHTDRSVIHNDHPPRS